MGIQILGINVGRKLCHETSLAKVFNPAPKISEQVFSSINGYSVTVIFFAALNAFNSSGNQKAPIF
jgi:hypothetical protein